VKDSVNDERTHSGAGVPSLIYGPLTLFVRISVAALCNAISRHWKPKGSFTRRARQPTSNNVGSGYGRDAIAAKLAT